MPDIQQPGPAMQNKQRSAQGSITIQRLRNGDSLFFTFANLSGKPLYQSIDTDNGNAIAPDWSDDANDSNRPVIKPQITSTLGAPVIINQPHWKYNGTVLEFETPATPESWAIEDAADPRFAYRPSDHAIKPIANLINVNNVVNGQLTFSCVSTVNGSNLASSKSIDVLFAKGGASSYFGFITATNLTLDEANPETTLETTLFCGGNEISSYHTKWYKDRDYLSAKDGEKSITVTRGNVDSTQLYIAEFYLSASDTKPVAYAGVTVVDAADEYDVVMEITSTNQYIDDANPSVTVKAHLVSNTTGAFQANNIKWMLDVIDPETFKSIKSSDTDTIEVTTAETDRVRTVDGQQVLVCSDVDVMAEAHWGLNFTIPTAQIDAVVPYWRDENYVKGEASLVQDRVMITF